MKKAQEIRNSLIEISNNDRLLILEVLEILMEEMENDPNSYTKWDGKGNEDFLLELIELYKKLEK